MLLDNIFIKKNVERLRILNVTLIKDFTKCVRLNKPVYDRPRSTLFNL